MTTFTHTDHNQLGATLDFIKVKAVGSTLLTSAATSRDVVMQLVCANGTTPYIVGKGYTIGSDSYLIVAVKQGTWGAAALQAAIRAADTSDGLDDCTVTISATLDPAAA